MRGVMIEKDKGVTCEMDEKKEKKRK